MRVTGIFFSEHLIHSLGWTLLHSIWQGSLVAILFFMVVGLFDRTWMKARYVAGVCALVFMFGISLVTFISLFNQIASESTQAYNIISLGSLGNISNLGVAATASGLRAEVNRYLPFIVSLWYVGCLFMSVRLAGGCWYNHRLRTRGLKSVSVSITRLFISICRRAGLFRSIRLFESNLVKVPQVIGILKPIVLLPLGLVFSLPPVQVEAILAHEIAHIVRRDYLINMLQSVLDIVYFYHPAVRWISAEVRRVREHCCDDLAVTLVGNSSQLMKALASLGEYTMKNRQYALAFTGQRYQLFERISRLAGRSARSSLQTGLVGFMITAIMLAILLTNISSSADTPPTIPLNDPGTESPLPEPAIFLAQEAVEQHEPDLDPKMIEHDAELERLNAELAKLDEELHKMDAELKRKDAEMQRKDAEFREIEAQLQLQEKELQAKEAELRAKEAELQAHEQALSRHESDLKDVEIDLIDHQTQLNLEDIFLDRVKDELYRDGLIGDKNDYTFELTPKKLIVNGHKQPAEVHNKYKALYEELRHQKLTTGLKITQTP
ncbi:M48 family metalloprotease [bacterium]|nr:M48 family metalloprotease [bacterium]